MTDRLARIYLDHAATSWPKPDAVYAAVDEYQRAIGSAYGRSGTDAALRVRATVDRCRARAARLLGVGDPRRVIFTFNCTDALHLGLHGLLLHGDHVVTSTLEHNSIARPLRQLEERGTIEVTRIVPTLRSGGRITVEQVAESLQPNTRLIALQHASNVTGVVQDIPGIGALARAEGVWFLVDAAQTAGSVPISFDAWPVDLLACAGHKGLLGPLGTGLLCLSPAVAKVLEPVRLGGTGTRSESDRQPETLPDRFEAGNLNVPGLFGLDAALGELLTRGVDGVRTHELALTRQFLDGAAELRGVTLIGPAEADERRIGVASLTSEEFDPQTLATLLAQEFGVETRAGLHCAPGTHALLGTLATGGTVRFSFGPFSTAEHVGAAIEALAALHETR